MNHHHPSEDRNDQSTIVSSSSTYSETEHARLRRQQRCIDKKDLDAAKKYGTCEPHYWAYQRKKGLTDGTTSNYRYEYNDIFYIVNKRTKKEVTCYARPMELKRVPISKEMNLHHRSAVEKIRNDLDCWTSNTVIVIDTSGSMRTSDMWGTRDRLKAVWFSVALDFIAERLESGNATYTDVVSIVTMGETPTILFQDLPTSWVLYNKLAKIYSRYKIQAEGHGNYLPSLAVAEELLRRNSNASCAAALIFLSDGAPSDGIGKAPLVEKVESFAKIFGRRLTFTAIGIGDIQEFDVLQSMVEAAKEYGVIAEFKLPFMSTSSLGQTFTSVATSLTETQAEMTDVGSLKQRKVREVSRESKSKANIELKVISEEDFWLYPKSAVTRKIYKETILSDGKRRISYETVNLQHPDAEYVAFAKGPFGEGAERFAYRFYEVRSDRKTIVGSPMVAKESRMILEAEGNESHFHARQDFVEKFIMTQQIARRLAVKFNERMKQKYKIISDETPQISFLDCSIYELDDIIIGKASVLVEAKLDSTKWYKWNSNNGLVNGKRNANKSDENALLFKGLGINEIGYNTTASNDLGKIIECDEDEDDEENVNNFVDNVMANNPMGTVFTPSQVAQAFSHFSYIHSDRKRLVCDLQGVYDEEINLLQLSDPVIHYFNALRADKRGIHGRTDRGRAGIQDFFHSHCCEEQGHLCQLLTRGFRSVRSRSKTTTGSRGDRSTSERPTYLNDKDFVHEILDDSNQCVIC